jgi:hypothetical protein
MVTLLLATALAAPAAEPLPPAPKPPRAPAPDRDRAPTPDDPPAFGSDIAVGYHTAVLSGPWPESGAHGVVAARYDAFVVSRAAPGPRLGLSFWGATTAWPLQTGLDEGASAPVEVRYLQTGVMAALRPDPALRVGADAALGFSRLELQDYYGGPLVLPVLTFEAGPRFRAGDRAYVDLLARGQWATGRSGAVATALEEWWIVGLGIEVGAHVR